MVQTEKDLTEGTTEFRHGWPKTAVVALIASTFLLAPLTPPAARADDAPTGKVTICHKGHTITITRGSLNNHLAHGDTIGACSVTGPN